MSEQEKLSVPDDWVIGVVTGIDRDHDGPFAHLRVFKAALNAGKPAEPWRAKGTHLTVSLKRKVLHTKDHVSGGSILFLWSVHPKCQGWRAHDASLYGKSHEEVDEVVLSQEEWNELETGVWIYPGGVRKNHRRSRCSN